MKTTINNVIQESPFVNHSESILKKHDVQTYQKNVRLRIFTEFSNDQPLHQGLVLNLHRISTKGKSNQYLLKL